MKHASFEKSLTVLVFILIVLMLAADTASAETLSTQTASIGLFPKFVMGALFATFVGAKLFRPSDRTL